MNSDKSLPLSCPDAIARLYGEVDVQSAFSLIRTHEGNIWGSFGLRGVAL
jgi:hypothetical protein